jgi:hypothetical protein
MQIISKKLLYEQDSLNASTILKEKIAPLQTQLVSKANASVAPIPSLTIMAV